MNNNKKTFVDIIGWIIFFLALVQFILSTYRMKLDRIEKEKKQLLILNKGDDVGNLDQARIAERLREEINKVKEQKAILEGLLGKEKVIDHGTDEILYMKKELNKY